MIAEPILAFFLLRYLRKTLRTNGALAEWHKPLAYAMIGVGVILVIQQVFSAGAITIWIWHALLALIIIAMYKKHELAYTRNIMFAILPLIIVFIISDIIKLLPDKLFGFLKGYAAFALPFAFIWMIAMFVMTNKQRKALEKERKKTYEEEQQNKIMAARKAELEEMVTKRTAEIMQQKEELEKALVELRTTQTQLIQSEKMASLGELTAGVAHEIQNPLNFVNNFSEVTTELLDEMNTALADGNKQEAFSIAADIKQNLERVIHHGKRADTIVKGMLQHSRSSTGQKEPTDINALADEYLRLSYHGLRAKDKSFNANIKTDFDENMGMVNIVPQDIGRVLLNLFTNAFYAVTEKKNASIPVAIGTPAPQLYEPTVSVSTKLLNSSLGPTRAGTSGDNPVARGLGVEIRVSDNGNGIPQKVIDKIFQPFFTTKPTGQGTGLGLSLSYDIIKAHGGEIKVESEEGGGSEFIIQLPVV